MTTMWDRTWWARFAVGLSVALNVFFVAFLLAQAWQLRRVETAPAVSTTAESAAGPSAREILHQLVRTLPPDDAQLLRQAFADKVPQLASLRRQSLLAAEQVRRDIGGQPLDIEKLRADLAAAREAREKIRPVIEQVLLDVLPRMSDAGRQVLRQYRLRPTR